MRPVPDRLILGGLGQLEPDVEAAEEIRARLEQLVIVLRDPRESADLVIRDAGRAPVLQHIELDRAFFAGRRIGDLDRVEGAHDGGLTHLDGVTVGRGCPGFDHVTGGGAGAVAETVVRVHRPLRHVDGEVERRRWLRQLRAVDVPGEQERPRIGLRRQLAELELRSNCGRHAVPPSQG